MTGLKGVGDMIIRASGSLCQQGVVGVSGAMDLHQGQGVEEEVIQVAEVAAEGPQGQAGMENVEGSVTA